MYGRARDKKKDRSNRKIRKMRKPIRQELGDQSGHLIDMPYSPVVPVSFRVPRHLGSLFGVYWHVWSLLWCSELREKAKWLDSGHTITTVLKWSYLSSNHIGPVTNDQWYNRPYINIYTDLYNLSCGNPWCYAARSFWVSKSTARESNRYPTTLVSPTVWFRWQIWNLIGRVSVERL